METLTIEIRNPKAKKLIDDLVDLDLINLIQPKSAWSKLWSKLDSKLPQSESDMTEEDILMEIKQHRAEKRSKL